MDKPDAFRLIIETDGGITHPDWERDTLIIELGYSTTFDLYHHDQVMYLGWF